MALIKAKKQEVVQEVVELLSNSKLTVIAKYQGTGVKPMQDLRRDARASGTKVKVIKNRLVIQALKSLEGFKDTETSALQGMLLYAFNSEDEVAPAQSLHAFAKANPSLEFVGAIGADGQFMAAVDVKTLAVLPSRDQLVAGLINTLGSPVQGVMSSLGGNLHGLLQSLEAKAAS